MGKNTKRVLSMLLTLAIMLSAVPVSAVIPTANSVETVYLVNVDFEDYTIGMQTEQSGDFAGGKVTMRSGGKTEIVECNGSNALHLTNAGSTDQDQMYFSYRFAEQTKQVTVSYDFALGTNGEADFRKNKITFPSLLKDTNTTNDAGDDKRLVASFGTHMKNASGDTWLYYGAAEATTVTTPMRIDKNNDGTVANTEDIAKPSTLWHNIKLVWTPASEGTVGTVVVYYDGKLTNVSTLNADTTSVDTLFMRLWGSSTRSSEIWLDNIKVYESETPSCSVCTWKDGVCTVCGASCGHDYLPATCIAPSVCSICGKTEGEAISHSYVGENGLCVNGCGKTEIDNECNNTLAYFDFEDGVNPGEDTGITEGYGDVAYSEIVEKNGNKVLRLTSTADTSYRWQYDLGATYNSVTVSYNVAVGESGTNGIMMFPTVAGSSSSWTPNVEFGARRGTLKWSTNQGSPVNPLKNAASGSEIAFKSMLWYTVKLVYDYDSAAGTTTAQVYIDDVLTDAKVSYTSAKAIRYIMVKFYKSANELYIDNLRVTVDDHTPLGETPPLQSLDHGISNGDVGFAGDTLDFTMDFEDVEENYYPGTLSPSAAHKAEGGPDYFLGVKEVNGNKVLYMEAERAGWEDAVNWYYKLNGNYKKATLSYYVAQVSAVPQLVAYPTLSNAHYWNPAVKIGIYSNVDDELLWYQNKVGWTKIKNNETEEWIHHDFMEWHQIKIVYDATSGEPTVKVYVDGALTDVGGALVATSDDVSHIVVRMCGYELYGGNLYMDNFRVTEEDHEPMSAPKSLIPDTKVNSMTANVSSLKLTVGGHQYITPSVYPTEVDTTKVTYASSNPDVAVVDEWGEVCGVSAGSAIITVTSQSNNAVKLNIPVTVTTRSVMKVIYVSATGGGNGSSANSRCTLQEAMAQISALHGSMTGDVVVLMASGYYQLSETLKFDVTHGGTNNHFVTYKAEGVVTIGGKQVITGWTAYKDGIYVAPAADIETRHLYVNNIRAVRARSQGSLVNAECYLDSAGNIIGYTSDSIELSKYAHPEDLEFVYNYKWINSRSTVDRIVLNDDGNKVHITMSQPGWNWMRDQICEDVSTLSYYENALELLDEPGEWYLDTHAGKIYYMPREWENIANAEISVPVVEELVSIEGTDYSNKVQGIIFDGITFADATWNYPTEMGVLAVDQNNHLEENSVYGDKLIDGAVTLKKANSVNFTNCVFTRLGSIGLKMVEGVQNSMSIGNVFYDISGSAIAVGEPNYFDKDCFNPSNPELMMKNCDILNNYIHQIGVDYHSSAGLSVGYAANMDISHNEIFDVPYSGMHIGYGWKIRSENILKNMRIEYNLIYNTGSDEVYDGGPIYVNGDTAGTKENPNVIANNYIRDSYRAIASIYTDGGASGWYLTNNFMDERKYERDWSIVYKPTIYNQSRLTARNNYVTYDSDAVEAGGLEVDIEPAIVVDPNNYPTEVKTIIQNAGLQSAYKHLKGQYAAIIVTNFGDKLEIKRAGDAFQVAVNAHDGTGTLIENPDITAYYSIENTAVATVTAGGLVTAVATGATKLKITLISGTVVREYVYDIYVADVLMEIMLQNSNTLQGGIALYVGSNGYVPIVSGKMALGREIILTDIDLAVADSSIAYIENGMIVAKSEGKTTLTIKGRYGGVERTISCDLEVRISGENQGNGYTLYNMPELFDQQYTNYWKYIGDYVPTGGIQYGDGTVYFIGQYDANFVGTTYLNELLTFGLFIDTTPGTGGWPAIVIRNQETNEHPTHGDCYIICFDGTSGLEFYRFNRGKRTQFYGTVVGYEQILGPDLKGYFNDNTYYEVQYGAINEADGVRIILRLNGVEVINYLDTSSDAIREAGFFGVCGRRETMTLTYIALEGDGSDCIDENKDHLCDDCGKPVGLHAPAVGTHVCDYCGQIVSQCSDSSEDEDHLCDQCGLTLSDCFDNDNNHKCDDCGKRTSTCVDEDKDHICDACGRRTRCADKDPKDHQCDTCGKVLSECEDKKPKDHMCDTCGKELSQCVDGDNDHMCDICKTQLTQCIDENKDKKCDICGADQGDSETSVVWIVVLLVLGAMLCGGGAAVVVLRRKRKQ